MGRTGIAVSSALAALLLSGCGDDVKILPPVTEAVPAPSLDFDGSLEPAAAVLPLVPDTVSTLLVTDFDQVRLQLGVPDLATDDPRADRDAFWARAGSESPLLSAGMLRPMDPKLRKDHGLSQLDVSWEAHFVDATGAESGYVIAFRDGTEMGAVQDAVDAGLDVLAGADVDADRGLVTSGTTDDGEESWAADAEIRPLVGEQAIATYLARGCIDDDDEVSGELEELDTYSIQFEGTLVTARLGEGRTDLFDRMRAGSAVPEFAAAYDGGVADPLTGRIGYVMTDPAAAADLAVEQALPFAACP